MEIRGADIPLETIQPRLAMTSTRQMVYRALVTGFIGYAVVVAFYAAVDLLAGRGLLHTGEVLGMAFFRKLWDPNLLASRAALDVEALLWHNLMHLSVSITIGFIVIGLIEDALRNPRKARFVLFTFFLGFAVTVATMAFVTNPIRTLLPIWSIVASNAAAVIIAGTVILRWYPGLWRALSAGTEQLQV